MNLYVLYSNDCFATHKFPRVRELSKLDHSPSPSIMEINSILHHKFDVSRSFFLNNKNRLFDSGWDLISIDAGSNIRYRMVVDLEHPKISAYNRHLKINSVLDE